MILPTSAQLSWEVVENLSILAQVCRMVDVNILSTAIPSIQSIHFNTTKSKQN